MKLNTYFKKIAATLLITLTLLIGCTNTQESTSTVSVSEDSKKIAILATTPMLGEFVKQVGTDNIDLRVLIPYGADPHHYEPSPQDVTKITEADLIFYVGLKYEPSSLNKLLINSSSDSQVLVEIGPKINPIEFGHDDHDEHDDDHKDKDHDDEDEHDDDHKDKDHDDEDEHDDDHKDKDHDDEDEHDDDHKDKDHDDEDEHDDDHKGHDHGAFDPHFWFDPNRVALAVDAIKEELIKLDPENKNAYEEAANNYLEKLKALDQEIAALIESIPSNNRGIVTTHESLGYLEDRYGLEVIATVIPSLTTEDGVTPKGLVEVIEEIKEHGIKVIFIESESPTQSSEIVAKEANARLVSGLWVETLKENQSYIDFLKTNINLIAENLKEQ